MHNGFATFINTLKTLKFEHVCEISNHIRGWATPDTWHKLDRCLDAQLTDVNQQCVSLLNTCMLI